MKEIQRFRDRDLWRFDTELLLLAEVGTSFHAVMVIGHNDVVQRKIIMRGIVRSGRRIILF